MKAKLFDVIRATERKNARMKYERLVEFFMVRDGTSRDRTENGLMYKTDAEIDALYARYIGDQK